MRAFDLLLRLLALATLVVSAAAVAATEWWLFDITAHFRAQYLGIQAAVLGLLALRARWRWCLGLLPAMAANAIPLAPYWPGAAAAPPPSPAPLTLMSANLSATNTDYLRFVDLLSNEPPDIVLLVELNAGWSAALRRLHGLYPYRVELAQEDRFGIGLFSRLPFVDQRAVRLQTTTAIEVRVSLAGRAVRVLGVHLRPPLSEAWSQERNRQLAEVAAIAREASEPLVVLGDFNTSPYSANFTAALGSSGLTDAGLGRGWRYTWPTFLPPLGIPIDLCMISGHFVALEHRRGARFGSDHYPLIATLALR